MTTPPQDNANPSERVGCAFGLKKLLEELVYRAVLVPAGGWAFMLGVGVVHHEWLPGLPTLAYGSSVLIVFFAWLVFFAVRPSLDFVIRRHATRDGST